MSDTNNTNSINTQPWWQNMVKKIDLKQLDSIANLKELIKQLQSKSDQYFFTEGNKLIAILASPAYFDSFIEKDIHDTIKEVREKEQTKLKVLEFIRELREYNKDADPEEIQADINEAVRAVKKAELEKLHLQAQ